MEIHLVYRNMNPDERKSRWSCWYGCTKRSEKMTLCGMESIILTLDLIKVLGIFLSQTNRKQRKFCKKHCIENVLKIWRMRNLIIQGKVTVLKLMNYGKLHYLCSMDQSKSFSQLVVSIFIFWFCPVEKCRVTSHCLKGDSLTLKAFAVSKILHLTLVINVPVKMIK